MKDTVYEGEIKDSEYHGEGVLKSGDGTIYQGSFEKGMKKYGKLTFPEGAYYKGGFKDEEMDGEGEFHWEDGTYYEGNFEDGVINGKGKITKGYDTYEGDFVNNNFYGHGTYTWNNSRYVGNYVLGQKEGNGKYTFNDDNESYEGGWFQNEPHGKGMYNGPKMKVHGIWRGGELIETITTAIKDNTLEEPNLNFQLQSENININQLPHFEPVEEEFQQSAIKLNEILNSVEFNLNKSGEMGETYH